MSLCVHFAGKKCHFVRAKDEIVLNLFFFVTFFRINYYYNFLAFFFSIILLNRLEGSGERHRRTVETISRSIYVFLGGDERREKNRSEREGEGETNRALLLHRRCLDRVKINNKIDAEGGEDEVDKMVASRAISTFLLSSTTHNRKRTHYVLSPPMKEKYLSVVSIVIYICPILCGTFRSLIRGVSDEHIKYHTTYSTAPHCTVGWFCASNALIQSAPEHNRSIVFIRKPFSIN